jgi:hypothetical protein
MKLRALVCALSLLIGGVVLVPSAVQSAPWISAEEQPNNFLSLVECVN